MKCRNGRIACWAWWLNPHDCHKTSCGVLLETVQYVEISAFFFFPRHLHHSSYDPGLSTEIIYVLEEPLTTKNTERHCS